MQQSGMLKDRKINTEQICLCAYFSKKAKRAITNVQAANQWYSLLCVVTHLLMNFHFMPLSFVCFFNATGFFILLDFSQIWLLENGCIFKVLSWQIFTYLLNCIHVSSRQLSKWMKLRILVCVAVLIHTLTISWAKI